MVVLAVVFLACFGAGVAASARWLPDLAPGPVGGLAFVTVCGLLAAASGLAGLNIYDIVETIESFRGLGLGKSEVVANGLRSILIECGTLVGLAAIVYLLAPAPEESLADEEPYAASEAAA